MLSGYLKELLSWDFLFRKKKIDNDDGESGATKLERCLNTLDLTVLGINYLIKCRFYIS